MILLRGGGIAHDFNNILGAILGYGEFVQQALADNTKMRRYIDNVMQPMENGGLLSMAVAFRSRCWIEYWFIAGRARF